MYIWKVDIGTKKVDIGTQKVDIGTQKVDIGTQKVDIGSLYNEFGYNQVFWRMYMMKWVQI